MYQRELAFTHSNWLYLELLSLHRSRPTLPLDSLTLTSQSSPDPHQLAGPCVEWLSQLKIDPRLAWRALFRITILGQLCLSNSLVISFEVFIVGETECRFVLRALHVGKSLR